MLGILCMISVIFAMLGVSGPCLVVVDNGLRFYAWLTWYWLLTCLVVVVNVSLLRHLVVDNCLVSLVRTLAIGVDCGNCCCTLSIYTVKLLKEFYNLNVTKI